MLWLRIQLERQETRKRIFWKSLLEFYGIFYSPCPALPPSCPKRDWYEYPRDPEKPWTNVNLITKESKGFDFECEVAGQREIHLNRDLSTHPQRAEGKYIERKVSWVLDMSHKGEGENQASAFPKSRLRVLWRGEKILGSMVNHVFPGNDGGDTKGQQMKKHHLLCRKCRQLIYPSTGGTPKNLPLAPKKRN